MANLIDSINKISELKIDLQNLFNLASVTWHMKLYEDRINNPDKLGELYRNADEREWRFVPKWDIKKKFIPTIPRSEYELNKSKFDCGLKDYRLVFQPNDIHYLIVNTEDEISEFIEIIKNEKLINYSTDDVERLMSRILSSDRIISDF